MTRKFFGASSAVAAAIALVALTGVGLSAQSATYKAPRTPDGFPDLSGVWSNNNATPLERPKEFAGRATLTENEVTLLKRRAAELFNGETDAAFGDSVYLAVIKDAKDFKSTDTQTGNYNHFWLVDREFDNRTALITNPADGRIPALVPGMKEKEAALTAYRRQHPYDGHEDIPYSERCLFRGVPTVGAGYNSYYQIIQAKDYVVVQLEMMHDARIIPIGGRQHPNPNLRQWLGDSIGHWEGETLVVETTNMRDIPYGSSAFRVGSTDENFTFTERFTRVGPDEIRYEVTVNDPTVWSKPWSFAIPWKASPDQIFEFACHEGNEAMEGTLGGARALEKAAAEAAKRGSK